MARPNVQGTFSGRDWLTKGELGPPVPQSLHKGVRAPPADHVKSAGASAHALGTLSLMGLAAGAQVGRLRQMLCGAYYEQLCTWTCTEAKDEGPERGHCGTSKSKGAWLSSTEKIPLIWNLLFLSSNIDYLKQRHYYNLLEVIYYYTITTIDFFTIVFLVHSLNVCKTDKWHEICTASNQNVCFSKLWIMGFGSINNIYLYDICLFLHCLDTAALSCMLPEEIHILFLDTDNGLFVTEQLLLSLERTLDLSTKDYG